MLTRESLLQPTKVAIEKVVYNDVSNEFCYVKEMTGGERDLFEKSLVKQVGTGENTKFHNTLDNFRTKLCVMTICDEKGTLLLKPIDFAALANMKTANEIDVIVAASQKINKISEKDKETAIKN